MAQKQRTDKREEYNFKLGPLMKKVLDDQKEKVKRVTYGVSEASYYEAGEIVAKKYLGLV